MKTKQTSIKLNETTRRRTARIRQDTTPPPITQQTGCSTTTRPLQSLKSTATSEMLGKREVTWTAGGKGYSPQTNYHHRKEGEKNYSPRPKMSDPVDYFTHVDAQL
ncbi:hypothetical protein QL285_054384 [Trifolium repens]|nr:hypothetical protein QL285_054384 [Trifolium repens]